MFRLLSCLGSISVGLLQAQGGFVGGITLPAPSSCLPVLDDFNQDDNIDLACADPSGQLYVFLGTGTGSFFAADGVMTMEEGASDIVSGDFNNDGKVDLAIAFGFPHEPSLVEPHARVWLGLGTGRFSGGTKHAGFLSLPPFRLAAADFDRDGNLDVAFLSSHDVHILLGQGNGDLARIASPALSIADGIFTDVDAGDVTGDGIADLAVSRVDGNDMQQLTVAQGNGFGGFSSFTSGSSTENAGGFPRVELGDVDGNGRLDAITAGPGTNGVLLWKNSGGGAFLAQDTFAPQTVRGLATADFDFEGTTDWAVSRYDPVELIVGLIDVPQPIPAPGSPYPLDGQPGLMAARDLNRDHKPDIVANGAGLRIFFNDIPGTPQVSLQQIQFPPLPDRELTNSQIALTATASSGLPVIFTSSTTEVCNVVRKTFLRLTGLGLCSITARQPGNQRYAPAAAVVRTFSVTRAAQTITFPPLADRPLTSLPFIVTATASSGLPVTFTASPNNICIVAGNTVTIVGVGQCDVTASQAGNGSVGPAPPVTRSFNVISPDGLPPRIESVGNAASYEVGKLAPASYGVVFGANFGGSPAVSLRDSTGTSHTLELTFQGPTQINFVVPPNMATGQAAVVVKTALGTAEFAAAIVAVAPGLFSADGSGSGLAAAQALLVQGDGSVVSATVGNGPIPIAGSTEIYLVLYGTGIRGGSPPITALVGGRIAEVLYAGPQGTFPALDQVNLRIPLSAGVLDVQLVVDGQLTNIVRAAFQ